MVNKKGEIKMSGGILNYLFAKSEPSEIIDTSEEVQKVEEFLLSKGYDPEAHLVSSYLKFIAKIREDLVEWQSFLDPLFHAVEWHMSGYYGDESLEEAIQALRKKGKEMQEGKDNGT